MPSIEQRLRALEAKLVPKRTTFWIHLVSPGALDRPVQRIRHNGQEWHRRDGESDEAFQARADAEAVLQRGHTGLTMLID